MQGEKEERKKKRLEIDEERIILDAERNPKSHHRKPFLLRGFGVNLWHPI